MSNAVLISIKPQWCALIANGKKTIEVRKTRPKIDTPFKCYIYETKAKCATPQFVDEDGHYDFRGRGQVIGEFVCDNIRCITPDSFIVIEDEERALRGTCLTREQVKKYGGWKDGTHLSECKDLYGWHISDLVIYDKPKELSEFKRRVSYGSWSRIEKITRPPQSWCYVE